MKGGLKPLKKDKRDFRAGLILALPRLETLPRKIDKKILKIINQTSSSFCTAASSAYGKQITEGKNPFWPALYAIGKWVAREDPDEWGLQMRDIYKALNYSVPMFEDAPESLKERLQAQDWSYLARIENYPKDFIESGKHYRNKSFMKVWHPTYDAYDTCRAIFFKYPKATIGIGLLFGWPLSQHLLSGVPKNGFGHKMEGITYDEEGIVAPNTYGIDAGRSGYHRIARETINAFAERYGLFLGTDMPVKEVKRQQEQAIYYMSPWWKKILSWYNLKKIYGINESIMRKSVFDIQEKMDRKSIFDTN